MRRMIASIAIGVMIMGGFASLGLTAAVAAAPAITATPSSGLTNGESVAVAGTGFTAGDSLYVLECLATATNAAGCATGTLSLVTVSGTGTFSTTIKVATGPVGTGTCGNTASDLTACVINASPNPPTADAATTPITFATPVVSATTTTIPPVKIGPRRFHVAPTKGLRNGSRVKVWGSGFKPGDTVYAVECLATSTSQKGCDLKTLRPSRINAKGVLGAFFIRVVAGKIGNGTCGTTPKNLKSCSVSIANASKGDSARVRITFK